VAPADVGAVPVEDAPPSWGRQQDWLAEIRRCRQREIREGHGNMRPLVAWRGAYGLVAAALAALVAVYAFRW